MAASLGVRPFVTMRSKVCMYTAFNQGFVQGVLDKAWEQLDWLNLESDGGFYKARLATNTTMNKVASRLTLAREEVGPKTRIIGITADNDRKIRGYRTYRLFYEESGSWPSIRTAWVKGEALVFRSGLRDGTRFAWGK